MSGGSSSGDGEAPCTIASRLFTFVIGLVVVGAALATATGVTRNREPEGTKPATREDSRDREGSPARDQVDAADLTRWQRIRSGVLLAALLTALGAATALVLLVAGVIIVTGLKTAVQ